jgi:predicted nucleic acid-binding protein
MLVHPKGSDVNRRCHAWFSQRLSEGETFLLPEICDYELRRKLLHLDSVKALTRLDGLRRVLSFLPLTSEVMLKAAELWASMRRQGTPTSAERALDVDAILAAQAISRARVTDEEVVIVTTNVGHLSRMTPASSWEVLVDVAGPTT